MSEKSLTYGEKLVGVNFNPSGASKVDEIKSKYASIIDDINDLRSSSDSQEVKRMASIAITELQTSQMWAVKSLTWKD